jgi:hypothetical protein
VPAGDVGADHKHGALGANRQQSTCHKRNGPAAYSPEHYFCNNIGAKRTKPHRVLVRLAHGCEGSHVDAGLKPGDGRVLTHRPIPIDAPALLKQSRVPKSLFLVLNSLFFKRFSLLI